jgi:hypothetical protein
MNYLSSEWKAEEIELLRAMIALVVRYTDGVERIQHCFDRVVETGDVISDEAPPARLYACH